MELRGMLLIDLKNSAKEINNFENHRIYKLTYSTKIKVGGICDLAMARLFASYHVDFLGLNLDAMSANSLLPETASEIINWLQGPKIIGEFEYTMPDEIIYLAEELKLDGVQVPANSGTLAFLDRGFDIFWQQDIKQLHSIAGNLPDKGQVIVEGCNKVDDIHHLPINLSRTWVDISNNFEVDLKQIKESGIVGLNYSVDRKSQNEIDNFLNLLSQLEQPIV